MFDTFQIMMLIQYHSLYPPYIYISYPYMIITT